MASCPNQGELTHKCDRKNRVFQGFGQAQFADGGSILGSSQFTLLTQLSLKMILDSK